MKRIKVVCFIICLFLVGGCAGYYKYYDGPKLPTDEVAIIYSNEHIFFTVDSKDARSTPLFKKGNALMPGTRLLAIKIKRRDSAERKIRYSRNPVTKQVNLQAGHEYRLEYEVFENPKTPQGGRGQMWAPTLYDITAQEWIIAAPPMNPDGSPNEWEWKNGKKISR